MNQLLDIALIVAAIASFEALFVFVMIKLNIDL